MKLTIKKIRLGLGWIAVPLFLVFARPSAAALAAGAALALLGLAIRAWAAGTIHKNKVLTTGGPYAYTRNPLYLGTFFVGLGLAVAGGRPVFLPVFAVLFLAVYGATMRHEARNLEQWFGDAYRHYARAVPYFFPRPTPYRRPDAPHPTRFEPRRYLRNGEYQAGLGVAAGLVLLVAKMLLDGPAR